MIGLELGNRERGSYSLKMTALLYYLINSLLLFLLLLAKIAGNELGNRERLSFLTKLTSLLYYLASIC